jgi:uncharacterized protein
MTADLDSAPWWEALARHELLVQQCDDCAIRRWPARALCNRCGSLAWSWTHASGNGTLASWIVNRHTFRDDFPAPYVVLLVALAEQDDILVPGGYDGPPDGHDLAVGLPLVVGFEDTEDGTRLRWKRAAQMP